MALSFKEQLRIVPLPLDERAAAALGRAYAGHIAASGGRAQAAKRAAAAVMARGAGEAPSEHQRLQRLYAQVYSRAELEQLMLDAFDALGLGD